MNRKKRETHLIGFNLKNSKKTNEKLYLNQISRRSLTPKQAKLIFIMIHKEPRESYIEQLNQQ